MAGTARSWPGAFPSLGSDGQGRAALPEASAIPSSLERPHSSGCSGHIPAEPICPRVQDGAAVNAALSRLCLLQWISLESLTRHWRMFHNSSQKLLPPLFVPVDPCWAHHTPAVCAAPAWLQSSLSPGVRAAQGNARTRLPGQAVAMSLAHWHQPNAICPPWAQPLHRAGTSGGGGPCRTPAPIDTQSRPKQSSLKIFPAGLQSLGG